MSEIFTPQFSETDRKVLESFTKDEIQSYIDFFRDYKELMWLNNDTKEILSDSEKKKIGKFHYQPAPQYPDELRKIGHKFFRIGSGYAEMINLTMLKEEGYFNDTGLINDFPCTFFTPALICAFFTYFYNGNRFCDGLLGFGVKDGIYLKMMLRLQDCHAAYCYLKSREGTNEK